jgi:hypothetical protein
MHLIYVGECGPIPPVQEEISLSTDITLRASYQRQDQASSFDVDAVDYTHTG